MSAHDPAGQLDLEILYAEVDRLLAQVPVAEAIGVKLSRLLVGFLQTEVLPQACRAADQGIDPTPLFAVVTEVLCLYADALQRQRVPATRRCPGCRASRPAHSAG